MSTRAYRVRRRQRRRFLERTVGHARRIYNDDARAALPRLAKLDQDQHALYAADVIAHHWVYGDEGLVPWRLR
jgi:hypothetical protein